MAKKKSVKKTSRINEKRKGIKSAKEIRKYAEILQILSAKAEAIADSLDAQGLKEVELDGVAKFERGELLIQEFFLKVEMGILHTRQKQINGR